jgi:hypothetical protein
MVNWCGSGVSLVGVPVARSGGQVYGHAPVQARVVAVSAVR